MDTGEVGDGTPDFLWHAGNENKLRYDVFLRHIGARFGSRSYKSLLMSRRHRKPLRSDLHPIGKLKALLH